MTKIEEELEGLIEMIPKNLVVRCCEGGGPENLIGTLTISLSKLIKDRENLLGILYGKNRKSL